jgi:hypothetical protein
MKKHYDFNKAEQGTLHRSAKSLRVPIYLDTDVQQKLVAGGKSAKKDLSKIVNAILRSHIGVAEMLR